MHPIVEFLTEIDRNAGDSPQALLERILRGCRTHTGAEAGTIYLVREAIGAQWLEPMSLQNDVLALEPIEFVVPIDKSSIAGYVASTGESLLIDDAYKIPPERPYDLNASFDENTGYQTKSVACIALRHDDGDVRAVVQLLNRIGAAGKPVPFDQDQVDFIAAAGIVISGAIDRTEMLERLAEQNKELRRQYDTIEALQADTESALLEARRSDKAKSEFLGCIGHELKTPLNAIIGFSELLKNEGFGPLGHPSYREFATDIADGGHNLLRIINDILGIVAAECDTIELPDDGAAAYACAEEILRTYFDPAAEANIVLAAEISDTACICRIDRNALRTVLDRVIDNAVKFTPPGGSISATIGPGADDGLVIEVADSGIGMTDAEIETALSPFSQIDSTLTRKHEGAGLGLSLANALVRSMKGVLSVRSKPEVGTTITITFPAAVPSRISGPSDNPEFAATN